jgi:hypothetical protein
MMLNKLFEARDAIHLLHLRTTSYAEHKALGEFYSAWLDLADDFIETFQGKYGRVQENLEIEIQSGVMAIPYLEELRTFVSAELKSKIEAEDIDLDNIIADMIGLINRTLYLLTLS